MKLKYWFFILPLLNLIFTSCHTQKNIDQEAELNYILKGKFSQITKDNLENIYLITESNEILKLNEKFEQEFNYSVNGLGKISHIDALNPQKIMIYFQDYQVVVFLDNTLSEIKRLNLENLGLWDIQAVSMTRDNFLWVYDPVNVRLLKINDQGTIILSSNELYSDNFDQESLNIYASEDKVYLCDSEQLGIYDEFGTLTKEIKLPNNGIYIEDHLILYSKNNLLYNYPIEIEFSNQKTSPILKVNNIRDFILLGNTALMIDKQGLFSRSITN